MKSRPRSQRFALHSACAFTISCAVSQAIARPAVAQDELPEAQVIQAHAPIDKVTLYLGRAAVSRTAQFNCNPGLYELHFDNLPHALQTDSLQARSEGDARVVSVDFEIAQVETAGSPALAELDLLIEQLKKSYAESEQDRALLKSHEELLNQLGFRITDDATDRSGSDALNIDAVKQQIEFVASERRRLIEEHRKIDQTQKGILEQLRIAEAKRAEMGGSSKEVRRAIVSVAAISGGTVTIELTYLVSNATWNPSYNVRAASELSGASVEYDALLTQRTGEDWENVQLTLSTSQPRLAANPPSIDPWYVDVAQPPPPPASRARGGVTSGMVMADAAPMPGAEADGAMSKAMEEWSRDAAVTGSGPAVAFEIPRRVTVKTDAARQQRTRIGSFDAPAEFVYVAVPLHTNAVYLRGELANASAYQLLPGPVSIFLGQDYVGPTFLEPVAPQGTFKVHFGVDPAIRAERLLVEKNTSRTGLLSGGRQSSYNYRITIDNGTGKAIKLELHDRIPTSRTDQIQIDIVKPSHPLATDPKYVAEDQPRGLLKWLLNVPAGSTGTKAVQVTYGVEINRSKDVEMTPLPE